MSAPPELVVRTGEHNPADRLDFWRTLLCEAFVPLEATAGTTALDGTLRATELGVLRINQVSGSGQVVRRTPAMIRRDDPEYLKIGLQTRGCGVLAQDGREVLLTPGDFTLYHTSRPFQIACADRFEVLVLMFPRSALRVASSALRTRTAVNLGDRAGTGRLVSGFLRGLLRELDGLPATATRHLADAVLDLLAAAVDDGGPDGGMPGTASPETLIRLALDFIERHLADPDLGPGEVAVAHHVSTRYLHKLFERHGETIAGWIRRRRLERCRRDLLDPALRDEPVSALAARWGLTDAAHFSRIFRAAYGIAPREYRASALSPFPDPDRFAGAQTPGVVRQDVHA